MRALNFEEIDAVNGGGFGEMVGGAIVGWSIGKLLDAASDAIENGDVNEDTFSNPASFANVYGA